MRADKCADKCPEMRVPVVGANEGSRLRESVCVPVFGHMHEHARGNVQEYWYERVQKDDAS